MIWALAAFAFLGAVYCLFSPVRWLGYDPIRRRHNPGFDEAKAATNMWIVRLFGVVFVLVCVGSVLMAI